MNSTLIVWRYIVKFMRIKAIKISYRFPTTTKGYLALINNVLHLTCSPAGCALH